MEKSVQLGPSKVPPLIILFRSLAGFLGGIGGTLVLLLIALLGSSVLQSALQPQTEGVIHPLFIFVFMTMVFLGSTAANIVSSLLISLTDRDKYQRLDSILYQIFILNVIILILVAPVYLILSGFKIEFIAYLAATQILISALASGLILETISDPRYALVGVYGITFAILLGAGLNFFFYQMSGGNPTVLLFVALPIIWFCIGLFSGLVGFIYSRIYEAYGTDFLSTEIEYGRDIEKKETASEIPEEKKKDTSGGEFLEEQS